MQAIRYDISGINIDGYPADYYKPMPMGIAYETPTHFVHFFQSPGPFFALEVRRVFLEGKTGRLENWAQTRFGAVNIEPIILNVGESIEGVWRPGLYYPEECQQALKFSDEDRRLHEQALRVLVEKLDEICLYIEPDVVSFQSYGHKTRELLILACTEVENYWATYTAKALASPLNGNRFTTRDYIKLADSLFLKEYRCSFQSYSNIPSFNPFETWNSSSPTATLPWYDAYNKTKHNRKNYFAKATFINALHAVVANLILYMVRFSPFGMLDGFGIFSGLVKQHFKFELINPCLSKMYVPLLLQNNYEKSIFKYDAKEYNDIQPFVVKPFTVN